MTMAAVRSHKTQAEQPVEFGYGPLLSYFLADVHFQRCCFSVDRLSTIEQPLCIPTALVKYVAPRVLARPAPCTLESREAC